MQSKPTIIILSDYGTGDPAFTEVMLRLSQLVPDVRLLPQSTPPFSTINTGYWMYQFAMTDDVVNTYIYSNTAPRKEDTKAQQNNSGEKLMYAKLKNGFEIVAVNAGYCFSFVKPLIEEFRLVNIANEGSQFRSRDIYPHAVAKMIAKDEAIKGDEISVDTIPDYPLHAIASIDGYGNIKTTTRRSNLDLTPGQDITITLNGMTHQAVFTDGTFHVAEGMLAFAPGSTGHEDRFMEIFYRGQSAEKLFNNPRVETTFSLQTA